MEVQSFLKEAHKYHLGELNTEQPHPKTQNLAEIIQKDLPSAVSLLKEVDIEALEKLLTYSPAIERLKKSIQQALGQDGRIFLCGCGATGRLSLLLEFLWREQNPGNNQVIAFMAGGDVALVHSLEGFEDYPEYGERHLKQLGFSKDDLLISCTEGGETPYVIGATEAASNISKHKPYFLYCNPDQLLCEKVERSKLVIENQDIEKICLSVGPMALSGSTRMQASTVLQLAVGMALLFPEQSVSAQVSAFIDHVKKSPFDKLVPFIKKEVEIYNLGDYLMYSPLDFGISVFTDTTERSPTFSLPSFEGKSKHNDKPSLCYIQFPNCENGDESWQELLLRTPRPINWPEVDPQTTAEYLHSFDFSKNAYEFRKSSIGNKSQHIFHIRKDEDYLVWELEEVQDHFSLAGLNSLLQHTFLKLLINTHSTLLMGLMGRYKSNIMTWVTPTNGKLIDRSARYIQLLLKEKNIEASYEEVVKKIFNFKLHRKEDESIVLAVVESLTKRSQ